MQTAAEESRNGTLAQFQAEAKAHVEQIHERSATEANTLRRQADDDVAAVREWSKQEIARIREETEAKISARKGRLETEMEQHAAMIEREIQGVQARVSGFEDEMAQFFERLLAEDDPTHFATMAENLPEPPAFAEMRPLDPVEFAAQVEYEAAIAEPVATDEVAVDEAPTETETPVRREGRGEPSARMTQRAAAETETETEPATASRTPSRLGARGRGPVRADTHLWGEPEDFEVDREAAFAATRQPPRPPRAPRSRPMRPPAPRPSPTSRSRSSARTTTRTRASPGWA
jgi:hypothetical protein